MIADQTGDDRLVPPIPNHPGGVWPELNPHWLPGLFAFAVQNSAYGVNSSALAEMSGTSRHGEPTAANEHWVVPLPVVLNWLLICDPRW
jgi:hypothetical protein